MSVIHNMFSFFAELQVQQVEEFNGMICAIFECQHFVDNSQLQHFRFHFRSHSDFSTARTVKINIFV